MDDRLERLKSYIGQYAIQYRDIETTKHFYARGDEDFAWLISTLESARAEIARLKALAEKLEDGLRKGSNFYSSIKKTYRTHRLAKEMQSKEQSA